MQSGIYISIILILQDSRSVDVTILSSLSHHYSVLTPEMLTRAEHNTFMVKCINVMECLVVTKAIWALLSHIQFELMKVMTLFLFHNLGTIVGCSTSREKSCYSELLASIECQHLHIWWTRRQMQKTQYPRPGIISVSSSCLSRHVADIVCYEYSTDRSTIIVYVNQKT